MLVLTKVFVNLMVTGQAVSAQSTARTRSLEQAGEVRTYAGGRQRAITQEGLHQQFGLTLLLVTAATVDTLVGWIGQTVQIRDHRGQRFFCVFHQVVPVETKRPTQWHVTIVAREVTVTEGV